MAKRKKDLTKPDCPLNNQVNRSKDAADPSAGSGQTLRQKAEALARERASVTPEEIAALSPEETRRTIHELRVRQIELEMQNEELRAAKEKIEAGRARYLDFYDQAPVGFCTLSEKGLILEANLTTASLLGVASGALVNQPITRFILKEDQDIFYLHRKKLFKTHATGSHSTSSVQAGQAGEPQECDLRLLKPDGAFFWAHLTATVARAEDGAPVCRVVMSDITERKKAGDQLRRSEERIRNMSDAAGAYLWEVDDRMVYTYVTGQSAKVKGYPPEKLLGHTPLEFMPQEDIAPVAAIVNRVIADKSTFRLQHRDITPSGEIWWEEVYGAVFCDADGKVIGLRGTGMSINARKQAEKKLEEALAFNKMIVSASPIGILIYEDSGACLTVNSSAAILTGGRVEQLLAQNFRELDSWKRSGLLQAAEESLRSGELVKREVHLVTTFGKEVCYEAQFMPFETEGKTHLLLMIYDLLERKRAEKALRESEMKYRSLVETSADCICNIDINGNFLYMNPVGLSDHGMSLAEVVGIPLTSLAKPECKEVLDRALEAARKGGTPILEFESETVSGTKWYESKLSPQSDSSGKCTGFLRISRDITERRLLEEERLKTQKLESVGTLAGGIAHDFNNLLQGVFGYISMAKLTIDRRDKSLEMLEQAERALHQSVNLTTQLLTFSKGGKPVKKLTVLQPVIENAVKFALSGSRSEYRITCAPDLWQVEADKGQLGQVIQNIVLNADQAMPLGGNVTISAQNLPATNASLPSLLRKSGYVRIAIQDNGVGIPEQYLAKIFDPYFTTKEKGSGLGLATSFSIIRNHDGLIEVRSEVGKGTTFLIYLPASETIREEAVQAAAESGTRVGRILLMDDEEMIREVAGELLKALGHSAEFADKGETALAAYQKAWDTGMPFDIVILDLTIRGGMGGEETIKKLREIDPGVKAIVSSGYSDDATLANYREQGFRATLKKPYNIQELQSTLNTLLAKGD